MQSARGLPSIPRKSKRNIPTINEGTKVPSNRKEIAMIYRLVGILASGRVVSRYVRADNAVTARVRAYKAFKMRVKALAALGEWIDIGAVGYDAAVAEMPTHAVSGAELRAAQSHDGADNTGRLCYKVSEAKAVRITNKAAETLKDYGF
jgi:hypothetical protein